MTIHHDKLAYGKLGGSREELDAEKLKKMLAELNEEEDGENRSAENQAADDKPNSEKPKKA